MCPAALHRASWNWNWITKLTKYLEKNPEYDTLYIHISKQSLLFLLSVVDRGFKPWSHQTKDNKIKFHCFSAKYAALKSNNKDCCIPVNPPPFRRSLPRKSLISRMDWVSCVGDINLPHTPFPPARSPPNKKIKYNNILTYILRSIFLEISHLELLR